MNINKDFLLLYKAFIIMLAIAFVIWLPLSNLLYLTQDIQKLTVSGSIKTESGKWKTVYKNEQNEEFQSISSSRSKNKNIGEIVDAYTFGKYIIKDSFFSKQSISFALFISLILCIISYFIYSRIF